MLNRGLAGVLLTVALGACRAKEAPINEPWQDDFNRQELGPFWSDTGGGYKIVEGRLNARGAYNHPVWLKKRLPRDAVVELDVFSRSAAGDIKLQLYGDGEAFDPDKGRNDDVTGYVFIFGGWGNSQSVICRLGEHDAEQKASRKDVKVQPGKTYHFTISRKGGLVDWKIDGQPFLSWTDPEPLAGSGHEYLAFDDWEADVHFDNLAIRPAP